MNLFGIHGDRIELELKIRFVRKGARISWFIFETDSNISQYALLIFCFWRV